MIWREKKGRYEVCAIEVIVISIIAWLADVIMNKNSLHRISNTSVPSNVDQSSSCFQHIQAVEHEG